MSTSTAKVESVTCENCAMFALCSPLKMGDREFDLIKPIIKRRRHIKRGEYLYRASEPFTSIYAVCSGAIKTSITSNRKTKSYVRGFSLAGEMVGADAISLQHYPCDAVALSDTRVCEVSFAQLEHISANIPTVQVEIVKLISQELQQVQHITSLLLGKKSTEQKLAAFLLSLSSRYKRRGFSATNFKLSMTRIDISNYFGLAKETVTRVFRRFQADGLITIKGSTIQLNDLNRLCTVADE